MADDVRIDVKGMDVLLKKMGQFGPKITAYMAQAGKEAAQRVMLPTKGLENYPPETAANKPPTPYWVRGVGMQRSLQGQEYNDMTSENLGKQWIVTASGLNTVVGNSASYAKWVHGDDSQAKAMGRIGWKKLLAAAKAKIDEIRGVYEGWVGKALKDLGL